MNRRRFLGISGSAVVAAAGAGYVFSDKGNYVRRDDDGQKSNSSLLTSVEREILYLASLAPSGHNTQPWMVKYIEPYHWIIENDTTKWLPAVDPLQRETILSIGAFIQNLEYAASKFGYNCAYTLLAKHNQDKDIMEIRLNKTGGGSSFDINKIKLRRTVRSGYLRDTLKDEDVDFLTINEKEDFHFISNQSKKYGWVNEQTIEANRQQTYRNDAQTELSN